MLDANVAGEYHLGEALGIRLLFVVGQHSFGRQELVGVRGSEACSSGACFVPVAFRRRLGLQLGYVERVAPRGNRRYFGRLHHSLHCQQARGHSDKPSMVSRCMVSIGGRAYLDQVLSLRLGDEWLKLGSSESIDKTGFGDNEEEDLSSSEN